MAQPLPQVGLPGRWPMGHLAEIRRDMLAYFTRCQAEYGDLVLMQFGPRRLYLLSDPELIEEVLVTKNRSFQKNYALRLLKTSLGEGLLTSEGEFWLRQRRLMQPAFARHRISAYGDVMVDLAGALIDRWRDGEQRDIHQEMGELTLRVAAKTLMDIDLDAELEIVADVLEVLMADFNNRFHRAFIVPTWLPTPGNFRRRRIIAQLDAVIQQMIEQRRRGREGDDLLARLVRARDDVDGTGMTDRQLRDEAVTLLLAGHETTANALCWIWYLLSQHPESLALLEDELETVLAGRSPQVSDVPRLIVTEKIVKEAMRLFPPAYVVGREALADCTIGDYHAPRGTTILMSQWVVQRDARWFADPLQFRPLRWTEELERSLPKYAYFPFGGGPRACIGNNFAMLEAILIVATIAQRFRLQMASAAPVETFAAVTLRPRGGLPMCISPRPRTGSTETATRAGEKAAGRSH